MQPKGQTEPANSVENRCITAQHNVASALPVKQNALTPARNRGLKENDAVRTRRHHKVYHIIHGLWVQTNMKLAGWRGGLATLGAACGHDLVFEELVQHLGRLPGKLRRTVREASQGNTGHAVGPCADFTPS
jgi:hypothetical protein